jgi:hypothetical protein
MATDDQEPVEDHTEEKSPKKYRKRTTDQHPLFGGNPTSYIDGEKWRRSIPKAGRDN